MSRATYSRRDFLRYSALTGAGLALAACAPGTMPAAQAPAAGAPAAGTAAAAGTGYQGKFVILSLATPDQNEPLIKAIEEAHPGVKVEWRGLTSERYTELFAASEVAQDQIDIMDLNGQDLRRYAVGGKLKDLTGQPFVERFRPVGVETYTIGGKLWAAPRGGITGFPFLYNKKALDAIGATKEPETYAELKEMAPRTPEGRLRPLRPPRQEHLPVAHLAVLRLCPDHGQQAGRTDLQDPGRRHEIHRPRTRRRPRDPQQLRPRRHVHRGRQQPRQRRRLAGLHPGQGRLLLRAQLAHRLLPPGRLSRSWTCP